MTSAALERYAGVFRANPADPFREVDVFAVEPRPFEELVAASSSLEVGGRAVRVASLEHLIGMKQAAGRSRDVEDVRALQRLLRERDA